MLSLFIYKIFPLPEEKNKDIIYHNYRNTACREMDLKVRKRTKEEQEKGRFRTADQSGGRHADSERTVDGGFSEVPGICGMVFGEDISPPGGHCRQTDRAAAFFRGGDLSVSSPLRTGSIGCSCRGEDCEGRQGVSRAVRLVFPK